jgi:hypothetical protein
VKFAVFKKYCGGMLFAYLSFGVILKLARFVAFNTVAPPGGNTNIAIEVVVYGKPG